MKGLQHPPDTEHLDHKMENNQGRRLSKEKKVINLELRPVLAKDRIAFTCAVFAITLKTFDAATNVGSLRVGTQCAGITVV